MASFLCSLVQPSAAVQSAAAASRRRPSLRVATSPAIAHHLREISTLPRLALVSATCAGLISLMLATTPRAIAEPLTLQPSLQKVTFHPPNRGAPRRTAGGASRGGCTEELSHRTREKSLRSREPGMVPLVPESGMGLTIAARPSFFVYLPDSQITQLFFSLKDNSGQTYYQSKLKVPAQSGIVRLALPTDSPVLTVGQDYKWSVVMLCEGRMRPDSPTVEGWVQRVPAQVLPPNSPQQRSSQSHPTALTAVAAEPGQPQPGQPQPSQGNSMPANSSPKSNGTDSQSSKELLAAAIAAAEAGLWYDALDHIQRLQQTDPNLARENWASLMQSAKLDVAASAQFINP